MTIDEAITHSEEVMMENLEKTKDRKAGDPVARECFECAEEHRQLAEWLKELKEKRQAIEDIRAEIEERWKADECNVGDCLDIIDKHLKGEEQE